MDICIDTSQSYIIEKDGSRVQASNPIFENDKVIGTEYKKTIHPDETYTDMIRVNIQKWVASHTVNDGMTSVQSIQKYSGYYIQTEEVGGCTGLSKKQKILSKDGKEISIERVTSQYPKEFTIAGNTYVFAGLPENYGGISIYTPETILYTWSLSIRDNISKKIHDFAVKNQFLAKNYIIEFKEIPWIKILYSSELVPSDRVVSFLQDKNWRDKNIVWGELHDLDATKKILAYYNQSWKWVTIRNSKNGYDDMLTDQKVIPEQLPIFKLVPIDTVGNYLLYTTDNYEIQQFAELCKPLVYIYSSQPENNQLTVSLPKGWYFSKLIPHFTHEKSWDFMSDASWNIDVLGKKYEYLYYSAKVPWYEWNSYGWQVQGSDMVDFFYDKIPKTGMNKREMDDFISFWKDEFHKEQRYFVSFKFNEQIGTYAVLDFWKTPDAIHRILLEAYPLDSSNYNDYFLWPKSGNRFDHILESFVRSGKRDVLEWGGVVFDPKNNTYIFR